MATTLVERVETLEKEVSALKTLVQGPKTEKDWRATFGLSQGDSEFEEMSGWAERFDVASGREIHQVLILDTDHLVEFDLQG